MKIHKVVVEQIQEALYRIFQDGQYADKVIEKFLKQNKKWGARDRRFFAENVYECVRWKRNIEFILNAPAEEVIEDFWLVNYWRMHSALPEGYEFETKSWASRVQQLEKAPRAVRQSVPDWLDQLGEKELGSRWTAILSSLNEKSKIDLRVNTLLSNLQKLKADLSKEEVHTNLVESCESALSLTERKNVFITKAFHEGQFEVQDRASQLVAPFLQLESGHRAVDACAGAGGKSLHMAALMKNKGKIISLDIHEWKLKELKIRARRNRVDIIETRHIENNKVIKRLHGEADRLLLDVPCSGVGVLRRNPDSKWKLSLQEIQNLNELQAQILSDYSKILKPGGKMVYSTCSVLPSENEKQVENFLAQHPNFELEEQKRIDPDMGMGDGFFMARLKRKS